VGRGPDRRVIEFRGEVGTSVENMRSILREHLFRKKAESIEDLLEFEKILKANRGNIRLVYVGISCLFEIST
jgi:hypothetical protein